MAKEPGIKFDVVTCVNNRNYESLEQFKEYLISLGLKQWRLFTVFPVGRAAQDPELQLSNERFRGLMEFIKQTRKEGRIMASYGCEGFLGEYEGKVRDHLFTCQAGISISSVMIDGSISACASIRSDLAQGNIYKDDFIDAVEILRSNHMNEASESKSKFPLIAIMASIYTTFILEEPIHPVGTPFPGSLKVEKKGDVFLCPVKDVNIDTPNAVCNICLAEQLDF